jgi:hypothetical protein
MRLEYCWSNNWAGAPRYVGAGHFKMLAGSGFFSTGKDRGGQARCGSVVEKLRTAWVR